MPLFPPVRVSAIPHFSGADLPSCWPQQSVECTWQVYKYISGPSSKWKRTRKGHSSNYTQELNSNKIHSLQEILRTEREKKGKFCFVIHLFCHCFKLFYCKYTLFSAEPTGLQQPWPDSYWVTKALRTTQGPAGITFSQSMDMSYWHRFGKVANWTWGTLWKKKKTKTKPLVHLLQETDYQKK